MVYINSKFNMQKSKFKKLEAVLLYLFVAFVALLPFGMQAQNLREQLQQCPLVIENGTINYYMPQQNGAFFQLPPARKPQYVNIMTVPWVTPLTKSVQEIQNLLVTELLVQSKKSNLKTEDKSLFLRKLAWCMMLQTSKAKQIDRAIVDYAKQLEKDSDIAIGSQAKLVVRLVVDYGYAD